MRPNAQPPLPHLRARVDQEAASLEAPSDAADRALMRQIAAGDSQAFETLYRRYAPRLAGYLTPWVGELALVDEVCNDVMLVVWRRAAGFYPTGRVASWIFGIAYQKARKARAAALRQLTPPLPALAPTTQEDPEAHLTHQEHARLVARALATLPPVQQQVILWTYVQQWPVHRIAVHTDEPVSTVKSRLQRARQRLARTLMALGVSAAACDVAHTLRPPVRRREITW